MSEPQLPSTPHSIASTDANICHVMVVDDSAVIRGLITRALESDPAIKVIASAGDGEMAIMLVQKHKPDVVVLDIEMPVMDGLQALPKILEACPGVKIIMASTLTVASAEVSVKALELGAADYIGKPSSSREMTSAEDFKRELTAKVKALGQSKGQLASRAAARVEAAHQPLKMPANIGGGNNIALRNAAMNAPQAIAIGSSTGGPQALFEVLQHLKGIRQPVFITQHMPATFTTILAQHITRQCGVPCAEAQEGEIIQGGKIYLAPGDRHFALKRFGADTRVTLNQDPPENFCRPAVDPMLRSLSALYGDKLLVAILTGMGSDGAKSAADVVHAGGSVIAQDEATSVVWGMPGAVANAGLCSAVLPLERIGPFLREQAQRG